MKRIQAGNIKTSDQEDFIVKALDSLSFPFYFINPDTKMVEFANKAALVQAGLTFLPGNTGFSQLLQQSFSFSNSEKPPSIIRRIIDSGHQVVIEQYHADLHGSDKFFEFHGYPVIKEDGQITRVIVFAVDITSRKKAELALITSESKIQGIVSSIDDIVYSVNAQSEEFDFLSPAFTTILGYSLDDIRNMGGRKAFLSQVIQENHFQKQHHEFVRISGQKAEKAQHWESWWRCKNGNLVCLEDRYTPIFEEGRLKGTLGILRNTTEKKKAAAERERLNYQLMQARKMEAVGRLAGGVAHEFNNLLGVILGHAEMALEETETGEELQKSLLEIREATLRSAELTGKLIAYAREQSSLLQIIELNFVIEAKMTILQGIVGKDIELEWLPGNDLWLVSIDPVQVEKILVNLCMNAREALGGKGRIVIKTEKTTICQAYDSPNLPPGDYVLLTVSDNGRGMSAEVQHRVFEPFFTTKQVGQGSGLGLTEVYGIINKNGGYIFVDSSTDQGTVFNVYLPRSLE